MIDPENQYTGETHTMRGKMVIFFSLFILLLFMGSGCTEQIFPEREWHPVTGGFEFPEGPAWDGSRLYISNCYGDWLGCVTDTDLDTVLRAPEAVMKSTNGLYAMPNGELYACDFGLGAILKITPANMNSEILVSGYAGVRFNRPNDLVVVNETRLYFTDPKSYGRDKLDGRVFLYDLDSQILSVVADGLAFPNGIGLSPRDHRLYVCESARNRIIRFKIGQDGNLSNKENFIQLPGGDPDGLDFDNTGNLFVAHFGTGLVYAISPSGGIIDSLATPGLKPTNLEFGGDNFQTLFLTEVETNTLYKTTVNHPGSRFLSFTE